MAFEELDVATAHARLAELQPVDVRAEHELRGPLGRVPGSRLIPLSELEARAQELPTDRPLLLVCRSGQRSGKACETLSRLGLGPVLNLRGGMIAWCRAQLPVERSAPGSLTELLELILAWFVQVGPLTADAARKVFAERLERPVSSFDAPSHAALEKLLDFVEESLTRAGAPPDLDLSLPSFRRSLAAL